MIGVGNDIVDLHAIDIQRTRNPRFYSKFLSPAELALHTGELTIIQLEYFVWLLWSVKEAAYKCLQRFQPDLVFSPIKLRVTQIRLDKPGYIHSTIDFQSQTVFAESNIEGEKCIHTIAGFHPNFSDIIRGAKKIGSAEPESQSTTVRELLLENLTHRYPDADFQINKNQRGVPMLLATGLLMDIPVSLAHHGNWVGYAYQPVHIIK